jgi:hypothetical protein
MADYLSLGDEKLLKQADILYKYALAHFTGWNIPSPQGRLEAVLEAYRTAFQAAQNPNRGKVDVQTKNDAKAALKKEIRVYVGAYLTRNPAVTDADRVAMELPIRKPSHTPVSVPTTAPRLFIDTRTRRRLVITYHDEESDKRGKPYGVHGIEVKWAILDQPPTNIAELINSSFDTKPPLTIDFEENLRGKKVFLCGRWEIEREGEKGPFGAIEEAIIP